MRAKRAAQIVLGLIAIALGAAILDVLMVLLGSAAVHLPSPFDDIAAMLGLVLDLVLVVALFFAIPQTLVLWRVGVASRWPYFLVGAISAVMFMTHNALFSLLSVTTQHAPSVWAAFNAALGVLANASKVAQGLAMAAGHAGLYWLMAIDAAICGFGWRNLMYRLPGETGRDWEGRVLGGRPPYSR